MPEITVQWFGPLRDRRGCDAERVSSAAHTLDGLWRELAGRHGLPGRAELSLAVARGDELTAWDAAFRDGDVIAFLPPVAGG